MSRIKGTVAWCALCLITFANARAASGQTSNPTAPTLTAPDGAHDFDFETGAWKTHLRRLERPFSGSKNWVEYDGTSVVRKIWNGGANLLELEVSGPAGHIEALSLRLYRPESHQWSLNFASSRGGSLAQPTIGEFKDGRGKFYDQETLNGRAILVRFVISPITPDSCHFEQAFSDDGGKTWEINWIADDTRLKDEPDGGSSAPAMASTNSDKPNAEAQKPGTERDGQHDFDPLIGSWKYHLKRRTNPLTGSTTWVEFDGTGVDYKVWDGRAQLDTIEVDGPTGHITGLTLRLYNPQSHEWSLYWANARDGLMFVPQIGEFKNGRGEFFSQDTINGKTIFVRFDWTNLTTGTPHFEQSFSKDGGKTWEVNWITDQTRVKP
jgi:hypothetical protein